LVSLTRRLRAPQQNGAVVAEPPLAQACHLVTSNRQQLDRAMGGDAPWSELRTAARKAAVAAARDYLYRAGEPVPAHNDVSVVMAGHQPELFHPGVWVKNFALQGLAKAVGAAPLTLVIDNDTAKSTALRVPLPPSDSHPLPQLGTIPFDQWRGEVPYEERTVTDEELFASFAERVRSALKPWGIEPLLPDYWHEALHIGQRSPVLGERLAGARRWLERQWGCHNLDLPVSALCQTEPFARFACHLLGHLPRFHALYNESVHAYRQKYGIRSRNHPVPDLSADTDGWLEAPFWAWPAGAHRRGRLMARRTESGIELRAGGEKWPSLPENSEAMVRAWQDFSRQGLKIRSRALTNTLYARMFVADLFVHGIGGGKYDELTDEIAKRFYGWQPPRYLVLSATLLLPLPAYSATEARRRELARLWRDARYNPQRLVTDEVLTRPDVKALVKEKERLAAWSPPSRHGRLERFRNSRFVNERLYSVIEDRALQRYQEFKECDQQLQANVVVQRRDFAFCLYPELLLRPFCQRFLAPGLYSSEF
jgi:hypothetical protein